LYFDWAWWERRGADSLTVYFTDGFVAIELRLRGAGTGWHGEAVAIHDVAPPEEATATAVAGPRSCP
jgi:hypothetical protein